MINLYDGETIDDLNLKGLKIIQKKGDFRFGTDAVLLANFAKVKSKEIGVELGSGSGIISTIVLAKSACRHIYGIEIQDSVAERSVRSLKMNGLEDRFTVYCCNWKDAYNYIDKFSADFVISNPPYVKNTGIKNIEKNKLISRQETTGGVSELFEVAGMLLKNGGNFFLVHRPSRLCDIFSVCRNFNLEPKEMRFVHPSYGKAPNMVLIRFVKFGGTDLKILNPLYIYSQNGKYTDEIEKIYSSTVLAEE